MQKFFVFNGWQVLKSLGCSLKMAMIVSSMLASCQIADKNSDPSGEEFDTFHGPAIPQPEQGPKSGRYFGLAQRDGSQRKFHVVIDIAYVGKTKYRVFIRLSPGEEESLEYSSFYFSDVTYSGKTLQFRNAHIKELWGVAEEINDKKLRGSFNSTKNGKVLVSFEATNLPEDTSGPFDSSMSKSSKNGNSLGISGYYSAQGCASHIKGLFLEGYKESTHINQDATTLQISGRLIQQDEILCRGKSLCLAESYTKGVFEPFSGSILLDGWVQKRTCIYNKDVINCDIPCTFKRAADDSSFPINQIEYQNLRESSGPAANVLAFFEKLTRIPTTLTPTPRPASPWSVYEGQFYGYVYHQALGMYQLLALNNEAAPNQAMPQKNQMTPTATLYFGEGDSSEFIAFPFHPVELPQGQHDPLVFDGIGDGLMIIRKWSQDAIIGDWYSKSYGYVGPLSLYRGNVPKLQDEMKLIQPLSGAYVGSSSVGAPWNLEITAAPEVSDVGAAFYPLKVYGFAKEQIDFARRRLIEQGSYHFYTGRVFFRLDDQRVIVGRIRSLGKKHANDEGQGKAQLELFWSPNPRIGTSVDQGKAIVFRRLGPYPEPRAVIPLRNKT